MDEEQVRTALASMRRQAKALLKQIDALDASLTHRISEQTELLKVDNAVDADAILAGRFDDAERKVQRSRAVSEALQFPVEEVLTLSKV